jgi:hypothetical protein
MMTGIYNFIINQGATFERVITWKDANDDPINLTNYTARMMIRENVTSATPFISLTSSSGITLGGVAGTITILLTASQTAVITQTSGVYDLELESPSGKVTRLLEGTVIISREVTR